LKSALAHLEKGLDDLPSNAPETRLFQAMVSAFSATAPVGQAAEDKSTSEKTVAKTQVAKGEKAQTQSLTLESISARLDTQTMRLTVFMWTVGLLVVALGTCYGFIIHGLTRSVSGLTSTVASLSSTMEFRMSGLETKMETRISGLETRMETKFVGLQADIKALSDKIENLQLDVVRLQDFVFGPSASGADRRSSSHSDSPASGARPGQGPPTTGAVEESRTE
jgi:hypothetical protein